MMAVITDKQGEKEGRKMVALATGGFFWQLAAGSHQHNTLVSALLQRQRLLKSTVHLRRYLYSQGRSHCQLLHLWGIGERAALTQRCKKKAILALYFATQASIKLHYLITGVPVIIRTVLQKSRTESRSFPRKIDAIQTSLHSRHPMPALA